MNAASTLENPGESSHTSGSGRKVARCLAMGLAAVTLVLLWQFLDVRFEYAGNWTALFCTGSRFPVPPQLAPENIYRFADSPGYDGQMYHFVAHDPFFQRGFDKYCDGPRLRYSRILIPLMAYFLAGGNSRFVDAAYFTVILGWVFTGAYWLSRFAVAHGFHPVVGLGFVLVPAVAVSIDRMTVDVALVALCIAFALFVRGASRFPLFVVLAAAALVRETGFLLIGACCLHLLWKKEWRWSLVFAAAALPQLGWSAFVARHTPPSITTLIGSYGGWFSIVPFEGYVHRLLNPIAYPFGAPVSAVAVALDYIALAGVGVAIVLAIRMAGRGLALRQAPAPAEMVIYFFALLAIIQAHPEMWADVYSFGRTLSPLFLLLALRGMETRKWIFVLPTAMLLLRVGLPFAAHAARMAGAKFY